MCFSEDDKRNPKKEAEAIADFINKLNKKGNNEGGLFVLDRSGGEIKIRESSIEEIMLEAETDTSVMH